ncbi:MAG TPA: vitamin K epoxide reductase family protein [Gemmatimonadaceae bacterium]
MPGPERGGTGAARERAFVLLSALGAANMATISLRQLGAIGHLPDPPLRNFEADRVTVDRAAWIFGIPDAPLETASHLANLPLVRLASGAVGERHPWLPLLLGAKTAAEAAIALWYFEHMRTRVGAWCAYCILGAGINVALAALALPAARRAGPRTHPAAVAGIAALVVAGVMLWRAGRGRTRLPLVGRTIGVLGEHGDEARTTDTRTAEIVHA